ncbi:MAG: energy-coupling factor transporter ATPase [Eubacterium sp.]|nr:energy-coupling factor transporter ATPase [Eubacterium sp.]
MEMIKAAKLVYEYFRRDEEGNVDAIQTALDQVDLDIKEGEFIVILGSNGSGKSTLARQMNAMLTPSEGYLWVDGKDVSDSDRTWDVRRSVGMVFQNPDNQIVADLVEEDVGFGPENIGIPTDEIWERVMDSLRSVGMLEYRTHSTNKLSGGEKQRVTIAGVLAMQPKCIVLDEPTAMLDPAGRKEVRAAVQELNQKKGITVLWITHFMEEAIGADRVYVLDQGKLVMHGQPKQIFSRSEQLKRYRLDVPRITRLADELRKEGIPLPSGILTRQELLHELLRLGRSGL